ncbi:MAG: hypothetical protein DI598_14960 [Pseudopedobacter saltans]|uniref:Lysozyme n=1 Tax=Pseudopedobacter saltans TaxID=151895 RepID=A0A2W5ENL0_9SPHI|nr:MAG: hypothetical protein DI598_14960 [Pseudopedobacter saltans]
MAKKLEVRKIVKWLKQWIEKHPYYVVVASVLLLFFLFRKKLGIMLVNASRKPSAGAADYIINNEGFDAKAVRNSYDPAGVYTIGYGTIKYKNGKAVKLGDTITKAQALDELLFEMQEKSKLLNVYLLDVPLSQNRYDVLVDMAYNMGAGIFAPTKGIAKMLRNNPNDPKLYEYDKNKPALSCKIMEFVYSDGKIVQGLINRRVRNCDKWKKG